MTGVICICMHINARLCFHGLNVLLVRLGIMICLFYINAICTGDSGTNH